MIDCKRLVNLGTTRCKTKINYVTIAEKATIRDIIEVFRPE